MSGSYISVLTYWVPIPIAERRNVSGWMKSAQRNSSSMLTWKKYIK